MSANNLPDDACTSLLYTGRYQLIVYDNVSQTLTGFNSLYPKYHNCWQVSTQCIWGITNAGRYQLIVYDKVSQTLTGINSLYMTRYHKHWQVSTHY